jgi:hypothetical protein
MAHGPIAISPSGPCSGLRPPDPAGPPGQLALMLQRARSRKPTVLPLLPIPTGRPHPQVRPASPMVFTTTRLPYPLIAMTKKRSQVTFPLFAPRSPPAFVPLLTRALARHRRLEPPWKPPKPSSLCATTHRRPGPNPKPSHHEGCLDASHQPSSFSITAPRRCRPPPAIPGPIDPANHLACVSCRLPTSLSPPMRAPMSPHRCPLCHDHAPLWKRLCGEPLQPYSPQSSSIPCRRALGHHPAPPGHRLP